MGKREICRVVEPNCFVTTRRPDFAPIHQFLSFDACLFMVFNFRPFATVLAFQLYVAKTRCICYFFTMETSISHDRKDETPEEKARWFQSLPLSERMEMLCSFTDLALTVNPKLQDRRHAQQVSGRIQVISAEDLNRVKKGRRT